MMWYQEADRHMKAAKTERIGMITYPGRCYESLLSYVVCSHLAYVFTYHYLAIGAALHRRAVLKKAAHHCYPIVMKLAVLVLAVWINSLKSASSFQGRHGVLLRLGSLSPLLLFYP